MKKRRYYSNQIVLVLCGIKNAMFCFLYFFSFYIIIALKIKPI